MISYDIIIYVFFCVSKNTPLFTWTHTIIITCVYIHIKYTCYLCNQNGQYMIIVGICSQSRPTLYVLVWTGTVQAEKISINMSFLWRTLVINDMLCFTVYLNHECVQICSNTVVSPTVFSWCFSQSRLASTVLWPRALATHRSSHS